LAVTDWRFAALALVVFGAYDKRTRPMKLETMKPFSKRVQAQKAVCREKNKSFLIKYIFNKVRKTDDQCTRKRL